MTQRFISCVPAGTAAMPLLWVTLETSTARSRRPPATGSLPVPMIPASRAAAATAAGQENRHDPG